MGAAAAAPRRAPVTQPTRKRASTQRRRSPRRKRPNRALASSRPRRAPAARLAQPALAGAARLPHAAVRTAGAVRDISDSSLIVRLTRGRGWIGLLGALLFGIVALNVISLSLNAGNGRIGAEVDAVERQNSALRAELAEQFSASRVEAAAGELGLAVPDPQDIRYMEASDENAEKLAKLLGTDEFLAGEFEPTGYPDTTETTSYVPTGSAPSGASTSGAPAPSPAPAPAAPASSAPSSGGGGTGGTGGVGL
jgi:hypothetical protein